MIKIKMLITTPGALDGIHIKNFEKGLLYSIPDQISVYLKDLFLKMGVAEEVNITRQRGLTPSETKPSNPSETKKSLEEENQKILDDFDKEDDEKEKEEKNIEEPARVIVMRVFNLTDEIDKTSKEIIAIAHDLGINVSAPQSGLTQDEVDRIKNSIK